MRSISTDHRTAPAPRRDPEPPQPGGELRNGYRPRPSTIERSREIREIAARYITQHGLWRFSMLTLAKHLNCLLPTLCYYYKKREDLITDIVLRHIDTLLARTAQAIDDARDDGATAELHCIAREYLLVALAEQDFHRLMLGYAGLAGPVDGQPFNARFAALRDRVEVRLTSHAPGLVDKPETARALSQALLDALSGAALALDPYGPVKPVAYAAMVTDWLLGEAARS